MPIKRAGEKRGQRKKIKVGIKGKYPRKPPRTPASRVELGENTDDLHQVDPQTVAP
jgi:hypothetical protein